MEVEIIGLHLVEAWITSSSMIPALHTRYWIESPWLSMICAASSSVGSSCPVLGATCVRVCSVYFASSD